MIIRIVMVVVCLLSATFAAEPIALSPMEANGLQGHEIAALTDVLRSELSKTGEYDVMERNQVDEILKEQGFQASGACSDASCAIEMGQLLAVNYMVLSRIGKVGATYTLSIRLVDVETSKIVKDIVETAKGKIDVMVEETIPMAVKRLVSSKPANKEKEGRKKGPIIAGVAGGIAAVGAVTAIVILTSAEEDVPANETVEVGIEW